MYNILSFVYASAPQWLYDILLLVLCVMAIWIFSRRKLIRIKLKRLLGVVLYRISGITDLCYGYIQGFYMLIRC